MALGHENIVPFHTYILKVASRCNINCTYCFVYNKGDSRWSRQPAFMSIETMEQTCLRIKEHCTAHGKKEISLIFHGGEPLLVGIERFGQYLDIIDRDLRSQGICVRIGMQSNGLLFNESFGELFSERNVRLGISIDGPPELNDRYRVDHRGIGTGTKLESKLELLSRNYSNLFSGFLVVVDVEVDPIEVYDYLATFKPGSIDFLLPYDNWDVRPVGKEESDSTVYAEWLIKLFSHWIEQSAPPQIRMFENMIRLMMGKSSIVESMGLSPVDLIVVETNGELEAVDSLKASFEGATELGYSVEENTLDEVAGHLSVRVRQKGADTLNTKCKSCEVVEVCGGGYIPNRYSKSNGFDNPSIYCTDLLRTIKHINGIVREKLASLPTT